MMPESMLRIGTLLLALTGPPAFAAGADCLVIAHRGASGYLPEHTLPAYRLAIQLGADYIEPDLVMTRDGFLVARHERALGPSTNVADLQQFAHRRRTERIGDEDVTDWFVEDFTLAEVQQLRAREPRPRLRAASAAFDGLFGIPELGQIVGLLGAAMADDGRRIGLYPELKDPAVFRARGLDPEAALLEALARSGLPAPRAPVIIQSFDEHSLRRLRRLTRLPLVQLLGGPEPGADASATPDFAAIAAWADGVGLPKGLVNGTGDPVGAARRAGLFVHGWTFRVENEFLAPTYRRGSAPSAPGDLAGEIAAALDRGMAGFFTDQPDVGRRVCARRSEKGTGHQSR